MTVTVLEVTDEKTHLLSLRSLSLREEGENEKKRQSASSEAENRSLPKHDKTGEAFTPCKQSVLRSVHEKERGKKTIAQRLLKVAQQLLNYC